jgi:hypothetical protein
MIMKASPDPDALVLNKKHTGRQKPSSLSHQCHNSYPRCWQGEVCFQVDNQLRAVASLLAPTTGRDREDITLASLTVASGGRRSLHEGATKDMLLPRLKRAAQRNSQVRTGRDVRFVGRVAALATDEGIELFAVPPNSEVRNTLWRPDAKKHGRWQSLGCKSVTNVFVVADEKGDASRSPYV